MCAIIFFIVCYLKLPYLSCWGKQCCNFSEIYMILLTVIRIWYTYIVEIVEYGVETISLLAVLVHNKGSNGKWRKLKQTVLHRLRQVTKNDCCIELVLYLAINILSMHVQICASVLVVSFSCIVWFVSNVCCIMSISVRNIIGRIDIVISIKLCIFMPWLRIGC